MKKVKSKKIIKKSYVCGIDWQHEIGECSDVKLYSSVKALKKARTCWEECGIVELDITLKKWVEPQNLFKNLKNLKRNKENA